MEGRQHVWKPTVKYMKNIRFIIVFNFKNFTCFYFVVNIKPQKKNKKFILN